MDRDQLEAFLRVVRDGSFTRAARSLGIGQPAVSARIQALEGKVGGPVFTRGRSVRLTALGEGFLPYATRAIALLDEGLEVGRTIREGERGRITMGVLGSLAGPLVGPAVAGAIAAFPDVEWLLRGGDHERVLSLLLDGVTELGLLTWPITHAAGSELTVLARFREAVPLVAHPDHPLARLARRRAIGIDDLAAQAGLFLRLRWWPRLHPQVVEIGERVGVPVDVPMETARSLLLAGTAVSFFVQTYLAEDLAAGRLVVLASSGLPKLTRDSALVRRTRPAPLPPAARALVTALRRTARTVGMTTP